MKQSSYLHKYSIDEQLCIHGQRPQAKYLADFDTWIRIGRFVKRGQKAICALRFNEDRVQGLYFFDVSQTYGKKIDFPDYTLSEQEYSQLFTIEQVKSKIAEIQNYSHLSQAENRLAEVIGKELIRYKTIQSFTKSIEWNVDLQDLNKFVPIMQVANEMNRVVSKEILLLKQEERMNSNEYDIQGERSWSTDSSSHISRQQTTGEIRENSGREFEESKQIGIRDKNDGRQLDELRPRNGTKNVESNQRIGESIRTTSAVDERTTERLDDRNENTKSVSPTSDGSSNEGTTQLDENTAMSLLKEELLQGTGTEHGKYRVVHFFNNVKSQSLRIKFLKDEYGYYGHAGPNQPHVSYSSKGVSIDDIQYSWKQVTQTLDELILTNQYLIGGETIGYQQYRSTLDDDTFIKQNETKNNSENSEQELSLFDFSSDNVESENVSDTTMIGSSSLEEEQALQETGQAFYFPETEHFYDTKPKEKIRNNIAAIRLSKKIQKENRLATPEEQVILAKYVGWGGIAKVFDTRSDNYEKEREELRSLVTEKQYKQMRESVLTAYYTDPMIIKAMYQKVQAFGFTGGKILDPAMGTGNFFSALPDTLKDQSELHGIELDEVTGTIAKQLHPEADIKIKGFEEVGPLTD